ncbi:MULTISPECIES: hypothetical protein [Clostridium]|jgi:hypothetical protein|uniref:hypothetical protein n=1 Tax=Clostridium TaxID=1485 RepID=UPI000289EE5E|nr:MULTISPECIES: hypothetical protein [Clostridium]MDF2503928.1 hypothetical protein [Clostridium sp.]
MGKTEEFISHEKEHYGKIYTDITFAIDEIKDFIDENVLKNRKYFSRQAVLDKYIDLLDSAKQENKKKGFIKSILAGDKYIDLLQGFKSAHSEELDQLNKCSKCECLRCTVVCKFDSCDGCRTGRRVAYCDHERTNVAFFDNSENAIISLINNNTGDEDRYNVLAVVQDALEDKRYILIENIHDKERFVLYYYPKLPEDTYGEITDEEDFNFAASAYENVERS